MGNLKEIITREKDIPFCQFSSAIKRLSAAITCFVARYPATNVFAYIYAGPRKSIKCGH